RSAAALASWLADRDQAFRDSVEVVAMDGFGGYKNAATTALPDAVTVMDPFYDDVLFMPMWGWCGRVTSADTMRGRHNPALG
ncbi:MAG: hypothetical protein QOJ60_300, partial [Actinomycetota bacterium]|nr:hypothetical protein [Actinomycetota bacterium]